MKPRRMTLMIALLFAVTGLLVGLAVAQPASGAKVPRPAAAGPSPEETLQKQLPPPAKPEELRAPTQAEMENACTRNPKCRAKLEQAKQGKRPAQPLPAATEPSPEEKLQKSLPTPAQGLPPMGPRSHLGGPVERFFAWLNPFAPDQAWAQSGYSLTFTPGNRRNASPYGWIGLNGGTTNVSNDNAYFLTIGYSTNRTYTENKPYVQLYANLPAAGYYLVDVVASPFLAKLRHQHNGPIIETWDYGTSGCGAYTCHYVTIDYYAAGDQHWYFWAAPPNFTITAFYSITVKSYP